VLQRTCTWQTTRNQAFTARLHEAPYPAMIHQQ
jgi:hypothetical protein